MVYYRVGGRLAVIKNAYFFIWTCSWCRLDVSLYDVIYPAVRYSFERCHENDYYIPPTPTRFVRVSAASSSKCGTFPTPAFVWCFLAILYLCGNIKKIYPKVICRFFSKLKFFAEMLAIKLGWLFACTHTEREAERTGYKINMSDVLRIDVFCHRPFLYLPSDIFRCSFIEALMV
jgi:hypothetical protein